jgi:hypothetical protein
MVPPPQLQQMIDLVSSLPGLQRLDTGSDVIAFRIELTPN